MAVVLGSSTITGATKAIGIVEPGTVMFFAGSVASVPTGFLVCNGAAVSRSTYADLFSAIGTTYGAGNGSTTFNLPSFGGGQFLRCSGGNAASLGTSQTEAVIAHIHGCRSENGSNGNRAGRSDPDNNSPTNNSIITSFGGTETRPLNYAMNAIIKF